MSCDLHVFLPGHGIYAHFMCIKSLFISLIEVPKSELHDSPAQEIQSATVVLHFLLL